MKYINDSILYDIEKDQIDYKKLKNIYNPNLKHSTDTYADLDNVSFENKPKWINKKKRKQTYDFSHSVSVFDVASYILKMTGMITTLKLQKLIYYCQAWSLVWDEKPLFKETIEAWANGPVVRDLFSYHRGMYNISSIPIGNPDILTENQKDTVKAVLDFYSSKSSQWLIDLSHMEQPWKEAREGLPDLERGDRIISLDSIANYYSSLPSSK